LTGIIATIAYRIIIVLNFYDPFWVKVAWYIGTMGFILYFGHRYSIQKKRANLVEKYGLIHLAQETKAKGKQKKALEYIVRTTLNSKSQWNSLFIFVLSLLALVVGILMDMNVIKIG
jgi:hypothetical protein